MQKSYFLVFFFKKHQENIKNTAKSKKNPSVAPPFKHVCIPPTNMFVYPYTHLYTPYKGVLRRVKIFENFKNPKNVVFDLPTHPKGYFGPTNPPQAPPTGFQPSHFGLRRARPQGRKLVGRRWTAIGQWWNMLKSHHFARLQPCKMVVFEYQSQHTTNTVYNEIGRAGGTQGPDLVQNRIQPVPQHPKSVPQHMKGGPALKRVPQQPKSVPQSFFKQLKSALPIVHSVAPPGAWNYSNLEIGYDFSKKYFGVLTSPSIYQYLWPYWTFLQNFCKYCYHWNEIVRYYISSKAIILRNQKFPKKSRGNHEIR